MYPLQIQQIQAHQQFQQFEAGIRRILFTYKEVLLDDFSGTDIDCLVQNTASYLPWLWILTDDTGETHALSALADIIPGRHAYIHGVSCPSIRRHPGITALAEQAISTAFQHLQVAKVKAEIEASNRGAKGFCLRMGFTQEACFKRDNRVNGIWQDVLVYSLFRERFKPRAITQLNHP